MILRKGPRWAPTGVGFARVSSPLLATLAILVVAFLDAVPLCAARGYPVDAGTLPRSEKSLPTIRANVHLRGNLDNSRVQFEKLKTGHVAFLGGSITEMNGYRPMVCAILRRLFPDTKFTFINAGIASTCSTTGAFRVERDVLDKGPVDLLFIEFAVNDDQDAHHTRRECIRGMEGIVRHARRFNPNIDIVIVYFVNPAMLETLEAGRTPLPIAAHEEVARHYAISSVNLAREVAGQIAAGKLTWKKYGGTHPARFGNALCAGMIEDLLRLALREPLPANARKNAHSMPEPLDPLNYGNGRFIDPKHAVFKRGWRLHIPDWKRLEGQKRARFTRLPMLCADQPGSQLTLDFSGTAVGAYIVAGPDAGSVETCVDGAPFKQVNLYHRFSKALHYPRTVMFATDLRPGRHRLTLRVAENTQSFGHAVRIMQFVAN